MKICDFKDSSKMSLNNFQAQECVIYSCTSEICGPIKRQGFVKIPWKMIYTLALLFSRDHSFIYYSSISKTPLPVIISKTPRPHHYFQNTPPRHYLQNTPSPSLFPKHPVIISKTPRHYFQNSPQTATVLSERSRNQYQWCSKNIVYFPFTPSKY